MSDQFNDANLFDLFEPLSDDLEKTQIIDRPISQQKVVKFELPSVQSLTKTLPVNPKIIPQPKSLLHDYYILSIDIGVKNLGYSIIGVSKLMNLKDISIRFGIVNLSESDTTISARCESLYKFLDKIFTAIKITTVIIEKQVPNNIKAMELMYAIYGMATVMLKGQQSNIIVFDPKLKFTSLNVPYDTKNKQHKRQSISYAKSFIEKQLPNKLSEFVKHTKKDDISDSINQALVWIASQHLTTAIDIETLKINFNIINKIDNDNDNWETIS